jgi:hypothetical protein
VGWGYVERIVVRHAVEHSLGRVNHAGGVWDYLRTFPSAFLPGVLFLPAAFARLHWRRPFPPHEALALAWFVGGFVLLSLFPAKRHHYLMPLYPGAALLIGGLFAGGPVPSVGLSAVAALASAGRLAIVAIGAALGSMGLIAVLLIGAGVDPTGVTATGGRATVVALWRLAASAPIATLLGTIGFAALLLVASFAAAVARSNRARELGLAAIVLGVTIGNARLIEPLLDAGRGKRPFLESIAGIVERGVVADYGGMHFAANWVLQRDVVPVLADLAAAERFLAERAPGTAFLLADRKSLASKGVPAGMRVLREGSRPLDSNIVLLGSTEN